MDTDGEMERIIIIFYEIVNKINAIGMMLIHAYLGQGCHLPTLTIEI